MTLCSVCKTIPFADLPDFPTWLPTFHLPLMERDLVPYLPMDDKEWKQEGKTLGLPHHKTIEMLRTAAESCGICQLINVGVSRVLELLGVANESEWYRYGDKSGPPTMELFVCKREAGGDGFVVLSPAVKNYEVFLMGAIGYCVDYDSEMKDKVRGRVVPQDPKSPNVLGQLRTWLQSCEQGHNHEKVTEQKLPARVLDVGNPELDLNQIRLYEPQGAVGYYATLSHCWGDSLQFTTTKATIEQRRSSIKVLDLPQTFQDAVRITRELGLRYLWLDSLCICQDDHKDWERESSIMGDIYAQSYVSISAMRSVNDTDGFLTSRSARQYVPLELNFDGTSWTILAFALPLACAAHGSRYIEMGREPLSQRAWALQERYLAPRILHFASSQISFECDGSFLTEDGFAETDRMFTLKNEDQEPSKWPLRFRGSSIWRSILSFYSDRELSRQSDKLSAVSGLVRAFYKVSGGTKEASDMYVAGLWRQNIIEELCWQSIGGRGVRPDFYRAPSWSWASINCSVGSSGLGDFTDIAEVGEVSVDVPGENPYGEVTGGYLQICCPLVPVRMSYERESDWEKKPPERNVRLRIEGEDPYGYYTMFDVKEEIDRDKIEEMNLFIMPIAWKTTEDYKTKKEEKFAVSLLVQPSAGPYTEDGTDRNLSFRRFGLLHLSGTKLIDSWISMKEKKELKFYTIV
ncbi:hypothetical protein BP6252_14124 [Coleophoma cylindrospora]|uniref:Heterokaryon incompatibility domain-containing protein n=1 Tax=Coleophoma cylindrospora TaxID=1849047 RepID=A0A3D8Q554_9HELO|nr:hypothetical protein BP6252_14124 [Coleophoma cylindrospora]